MIKTEIISKSGQTISNEINDNLKLGNAIHIPKGKYIVPKTIDLIKDIPNNKLHSFYDEVMLSIDPMAVFVLQEEPAFRAHSNCAINGVFDMSQVYGINERSGHNQFAAIEIQPKGQVYELNINARIFGNDKAITKKDTGCYGIHLKRGLDNSGITGLNLNIKALNLNTGIYAPLEKNYSPRSWANRVIIKGDYFNMKRAAFFEGVDDIIIVDAFGQPTDCLTPEEEYYYFWHLDSKRVIYDCYNFDMDKSYSDLKRTKRGYEVYCPKGDMQAVGKSLYHYKDGLFPMGAQLNTVFKNGYRSQFESDNVNKAMIPEIHSAIRMSGEHENFAVYTIGEGKYKTPRAGRILTKLHFWTRVENPTEKDEVRFLVPLNRHGKLRAVTATIRGEKPNEIQIVCLNKSGSIVEDCTVYSHQIKDNYDLIELLRNQKNSNKHVSAIEFRFKGGNFELLNLAVKKQYNNH